MKIREVMTTNVVTISPDNTVLDASRLMQSHNIGAIPVCTDSSQVTGIVTDRDIVVRCIAEGSNPQSTKICDVMTKELVYGTPEMNVDEAVDLMSTNKIRRLPVVDNDSLVGIVTIGDIATRNKYKDEAGFALSRISEPSRPENLSH